MFRVNSATCPTSLRYSALLGIIINHFLVDFSREPSDSSSKSFDKSTLSKSLSQQRRNPLPRNNSNLDDSDDLTDIASTPKPELVPLVLPFHLLWIRFDINSSLEKPSYQLDNHIVEYRANFGEMHDQLNGIHDFLSYLSPPWFMHHISCLWLVSHFNFCVWILSLEPGFMFWWCILDSNVDIVWWVDVWLLKLLNVIFDCFGLFVYERMVLYFMFMTCILWS